jgi:hypothetical protein
MQALLRCIVVQSGTAVAETVQLADLFQIGQSKEFEFEICERCGNRT